MGFCVVDPVAIPVVTGLVFIEISLTPGENAKAATIVALYRSCTSSTPLVTGVPEGCGGVAVGVVAGAGGVGLVTVTGVAATTELAVKEEGMAKRGKVSVS